MTLHIPASNQLEHLAYRLRRKSLSCAKTLRHNLRRSRATRVVFLFGCGRSGTDITASCLARSMDLKLINEDNPLAFDNWRLKALPTVQRTINHSAAPVILLKPIVETPVAHDLLAYFDQSRALFLFRHYRDAINSMVRFFGRNHVKAVTGWVEDDFAQFPRLSHEDRSLVRNCHREGLSVEDACGIHWLLYNRTFFHLGLNTHPRVRPSSYEGLVEAPHETLRDICAFLDLEFDSRMTRFIDKRSLRPSQPPPLRPELERACARAWQALRERQQGRQPSATALAQN